MSMKFSWKFVHKNAEKICFSPPNWVDVGWITRVDFSAFLPYMLSHLCFHPRVVPSLPHIARFFVVLCTVDPDSNEISLNIRTWIQETPLDARIGILLKNCFLNMLKLCWNDFLIHCKWFSFSSSLVWKRTRERLMNKLIFHETIFLKSFKITITWNVKNCFQFEFSSISSKPLKKSRLLFIIFVEIY